MGPTLGSGSVGPGYRPVHLLIGFEVPNAEHERPALAHGRTLRQIHRTGREGSGSCGWQPLPLARLASLPAPFDDPLPLVRPFHAAQLAHALTNRIRSHPPRSIGPPRVLRCGRLLAPAGRARAGAQAVEPLAEGASPEIHQRRISLKAMDLQSVLEVLGDPRGKVEPGARRRAWPWRPR